jgi:hypothetical protein
MTFLRKAAEGEPCEIRVPGECRRDDQYTVLAHVRLIGLSGMSLKSDDMLAALGCDRCHDICDGRVPTLTYTYDQRRLMLLEAMARTQARRIEQGYICVKGEREVPYKRLPKILPRRLPDALITEAQRSQE